MGQRLNWGVKQSFRSYVEAAGGVIEVSGGAERAADGGFAFVPAGGDLTTDADGKLRGRGVFAGEVRFEAHGGMLKVQFSDPILEVGPTGAALSVAEHGDRRIEIALLDLAAASVDEAGDIVIPAALAMDGIQLLGDHYPLKTALDPVRLTLS